MGKEFNMVYNASFLPQMLTKEQTGIPDYAKALQAGMQTAADVYKPKTMQEQLLHMQMENKINKPKADDAQNWYQAQLQELQSGNGLRGAQLQKALADAGLAKSNLSFMDKWNERHDQHYATPEEQPASSNPSPNIPAIPQAHPSPINNSMNQGVSSEGPGANYGAPTVANTFPGRTGKRIPQQPYVSGVTNAVNQSNPTSMPPQSQPTIEKNGTIPMGGQNQYGDTYADAQRMAKIQGLPPFPTQDIDGTITALTPWGNYALAKGPSAQEKARLSGLGGIEAKAYETAYNAGNSLDQQNTALDSLISTIQKNPEVRDVIGPVNQFTTKWAGSPEQQQLLGAIQTGSGDVMLGVAHDIKGAWSGKDQAMVNNIKANANDPYGVFLGKLKAHRALNELTKKRVDRIADLVYHGTPPHEAAKIAQNEISFEPIKRKIDSLTRVSEEYNTFRNHKMPKFKDKNEVNVFKDHLTPREKEDFLRIVLKGEQNG